MVCLDYDGSAECSVCHEVTPDGYSQVDGKIICEQCVDKKDDKQSVIRASKSPPDSGIYVKKLEEDLLSCFEQWKDMTAALYKYLGPQEYERVRVLDSIEWFCCNMKNRLTKLKKKSRHPELWRFS